MIKQLMLGLILTGGIVSGAMLPASAQVYVNVHLGEPPAPIIENLPPPPGPDYEWHQGYWDRDGGRYVWHHGHYDRRPHQGAHWIPGHPDRYGYVRGHWAD